MEPALVFWAIFAFVWLLFAWNFYLKWRQYAVYVRTTERPAAVEPIMDAESFDKSRSYKIDSMRFGLAHMVYEQLEGTLVLLCNVLPALWAFSGGCIQRAGYEHETLQSIVFMCTAGVISTLVDLPWDLYRNFVIEERHGFNKLTLGFYAKDQLKKLLVMHAIGLPVMSLLIWIVEAGGQYFFIYVWAFLSVLTFVMLLVYPEFIAPLFDKYEPLPDGELKAKIEALADKLCFPLTKLYVVEGSKRSAHSNAYMYGLWNAKRIVLYDTILQDYTPVQRGGGKQVDDADKTDAKRADEQAGAETNSSDDNGDFVKLDKEAKDGADHVDRAAEAPAAKTPAEPEGAESRPAEAKPPGKEKKLGMSTPEVLAVLGHELGHWALGHLVQLLAISELNMLLVLYVVHLLWTWADLYVAFGFEGMGQPTLIGLVLIMQFVLAPFNEVVNFLAILLIRRNEFAADAFSCRLGYAAELHSGLVKMAKDNLSFPVDDWLYSTVTYSHPPLVERLAALKKHE